MSLHPEDIKRENTGYRTLTHRGMHVHWTFLSHLRQHPHLKITLQKAATFAAKPPDPVVKVNPYSQQLLSLCAARARQRGLGGSSPLA